MDRDYFCVKPRPERIVYDPVSFEQLPDSGAEKPQNSYWFRRINDGDIEVVEYACEQQGDADSANADTNEDEN